jgi:hypothetical protein
VEDGNNGNTALHYAADNGKLECLNTLVARGANLDITNDVRPAAAARPSHASPRFPAPPPPPPTTTKQKEATPRCSDRKPRFGKRSLPAAATRGFVAKMSFELEGAPGPRHHGGDDKTCRVVGNVDLRAFLARFVSW